MQAIILAAGMGRRLGDLTSHRTKCMVEVNGVKLIDRMMRQLAALGSVTRTVVVTGYCGKGLRDHLAALAPSLPFEIVTIHNPDYSRTNNIYSLWLAREYLCSDDTLLLESDLIVSDAMLPLLVSSSHRSAALVAKYESWMDGTMVSIDADCNIVNFIPKEAFRFSEAGHYYKTVNIYKFSRKFSRDTYVPFLEAYSKVMGRNEYYEQVLRVITMLHASGLKAIPVNGEKWYEIDDVQDLDIASTIFSDSTTKYYEYHKRYGGYWRFPQLLDFCYLVNPYFPSRRMTDEMRANFDTLLREYPSGMLVNSLLAGKYFGINPDLVVVGNGAAELIKAFMERHTGKNGKVGVIFPTFDEYPNRLPAERIVPFVVSSPDFSYSADRLMEHFAGSGIDTLLLINPDNPSGHFMPKEDLLRLAGWCAGHDIRLIVDESFVDFADGYPDNTLLHDDILRRFPSMCVMKSISKSYGVPGLRLGILASADTAMIASIKKEVSIWNINSMAEYYMQIFGKYEADYRRAVEKFREERERFRQRLLTVPYLKVFPSQANYFLCEVTDMFTSTELTQLLIEHDILISNCGLKRCMAGRQLIRLAIRDSADNDRLVDTLLSFTSRSKE